MANFSFDTEGWAPAEVRYVKVEILPCQRSVVRVISVELKYFIFICSWISGRKNAWGWKDSIQAVVFSGWSLFSSWKNFRVKEGMLPFLQTQRPHLLSPYLPPSPSKIEIAKCRYPVLLRFYEEKVEPAFSVWLLFRAMGVSSKIRKPVISKKK